MDIIQPGSFALLISRKDDRYLMRMQERGHFSTHEGNILFEPLIGRPFGCETTTHKGASYTVFKPTIADFLRFIKRKTQVLYAKDLGYIVLKLDIRSGMKVIECGSGSGAASSVFAFALAPEGRLVTYEAREEFSQLARQNVERLGLGDVVTFRHLDIEHGFDESDADALFLDVKFPERYLRHCWDALKPGGNLCVFVPTTNQVCDVLAGFEQLPFAATEVVELFLRSYKIVPERLRPDDMMNAHTGYLIFTRKIIPLATPEASDES